MKYNVPAFVENTLLRSWNITWLQSWKLPYSARVKTTSLTYARGKPPACTRENIPHRTSEKPLCCTWACTTNLGTKLLYGFIFDPRKSSVAVYDPDFICMRLWDFCTIKIISCHEFANLGLLPLPYFSHELIHWAMIRTNSVGVMLFPERSSD